MSLPELPEPELGYIETDKSRQPAFSARQMRAALQAQPAEVERETTARREAQEQLYAARERHTAEVKGLQAEIGRLQALATTERKGEPAKSVVIQCPMCADIDPDAACHFCSLLSVHDVEEWRNVVAIARPVPNTGMVPVKARTILAVDRLITNAVAAQAQPANTSPQVPEDTARLDWIERQSLDDFAIGFVYEVEEYWCSPESGGMYYGKTLREAIDAARKGEKS